MSDSWRTFFSTDDVGAAGWGGAAAAAGARLKVCVDEGDGGGGVQNQLNQLNLLNRVVFSSAGTKLLAV